jgi:hypothetical protein
MFPTKFPFIWLSSFREQAQTTEPLVLYILHFKHLLIMQYISDFNHKSKEETVTQSWVDESTVNESPNDTGKTCLKLMVWKCFRTRGSDLEAQWSEPVSLTFHSALRKN